MATWKSVRGCVGAVRTQSVAACLPTATVDSLLVLRLRLRQRWRQRQRWDQHRRRGMSLARLSSVSSASVRELIHGIRESAHVFNDDYEANEANKSGNHFASPLLL